MIETVGFDQLPGSYWRLYCRRLRCQRSPSIPRPRRVTTSLPSIMARGAWATHATDQAKDKGQSATDFADAHYYEPLPQETGEAGLKLELRKLGLRGG